MSDLSRCLSYQPLYMSRLAPQFRFRVGGDPMPQARKSTRSSSGGTARSSSRKSASSSRGSSKASSRGKASYKEPAALKRLNQSLATAQKALTDLRSHAG